MGSECKSSLLHDVRVRISGSPRGLDGVRRDPVCLFVSCDGELFVFRVGAGQGSTRSEPPNAELEKLGHFGVSDRTAEEEAQEAQKAETKGEVEGVLMIVPPPPLQYFCCFFGCSIFLFLCCLVWFVRPRC